MEINDFSSFFELFAGTCFLYAGSETFRFAFNETILTLNKSMNELVKTVSVEIGIMITSNPNWKRVDNQKKKEILQFLENVSKLKEQEISFRKFPDSFKSVFLMTGCFCLAILILGGFQQFFLCSFTTVITLCCLIIVVLFYNLVVFVLSFFEKHCGKNVKTIYPFSFFIFAICVATLYINKSEWLHTHYENHREVLEKANNLVEKGSLKQSFFDGHATIDERVWITIALFLTISPFILHLLRVAFHKYKYKKIFKDLRLKLEQLVRSFEEEADDEIGAKIRESINKLEEI